MPTLDIIEHTAHQLDGSPHARSIAKRLDALGLADVVNPALRLDGSVRLTVGGWIGSIPLGDDMTIRLRPKVSISRIWTMLHIAYGLDGVAPLRVPTDEEATTDPLDALASHLAAALAQGVLARMRQGLHRSYRPCAETLPFLRPRLNTAAFLRHAAPTTFPCHYHELTPDTDDNRLLAWTLHRVRRAPLLPYAARLVRGADRALSAAVRLRPFAPREALGRTYSRLTADYAPLHRLCHVLLAAIAPGLDAGEARALPFLLATPPLFESFVFRWMAKHLPQGLAVHAQECHRVGSVTFTPDLVVRTATGTPLAVLDTKHKSKASSSADVQQAVAYAVRLGVPEAWLVYPQRPTALDACAGPVRVRAVGFDLSAHDLDAAGHVFIESLNLTG